ncbi:hypothetical protein B9G98_04439 [Wickerhamiella sorbophila]|uniref:Large ribosomal subunit protein mL50 n=1 Tax=Wickerhamiella sorbophila TaxID=45607 RepID=A0A2T0FPD2_9ASCO|nr:hypothetical protein B9G98_04439 [Wickerhamiella sorbophila]PRT56819.1 hypothetical protein B9G98_04439 [Wickerhamiella sorbophila]
MPGQLVKSGRLFSTSASVYVFEGMYDRMMYWRKSKSEKKLHDPTKDTKAQEDLPEDTKPRRLRMLGKPKDPKEDWESVKEFAEFQAWPTRFHRSDMTSGQIESAVSSAFAGVEFSNISQRFEAVKKLSQELQIAIPDAVLSRTTSKEYITGYLESVARPFDEKMPDAIYLNPEDFQGTNITISDPVAERKERRRRYAQLLQDAKRAQNEKAKELLA